MKNFIYPLSIVLILSTLSCKKLENLLDPEKPTTTTGNINTGATVTVITQTVSNAGGIIKIVKPGDPLDGMEISISTNSFSSSQNINISYSPVTSHKFDSDFKATSPLIKIAGVTEFAKKDISLKVPIKLSTGEVAMAFLYNQTTGTLEGMPIVNMNLNYIEFSTRKLSSRSVALNKINKDDEEYSSIIVFSILESKLDGKTILATGFEPGYDDWEFVNKGSYIEPGGHCAGQAISALWYFAEKKKTEGGLFHKYDLICDKNNPSLMWADNPKGFRFASMVQNDAKFSSEKISEHYTFQENDQRFTWWSFVMAMALTKEPQLVIVYNKGSTSGHAVLTYKIDLTQRTLYIADPNFPNNRNPLDGSQQIKTIAYDHLAKKFNPYVSKLNDDLPDVVFNNIAFLGKYIFIDKAKIDTRWNEFSNGTIGNGKFPYYKLYNETTSGNEITDGMTVTKAELKIVAKSEGCDNFYPGTDKLQNVAIYNKEGYFVDSSTVGNKGVAKYLLSSGANKIGILVNGKLKNSANSFIDFKWVTINYNQTATALTLTPNTLDAALNGTYELKGIYSGALPAKYKCYWLISGETGYISRENDLSLKYQFKKEGTIKANISLTDNTNPNAPVSLGSAEATITVTQKPLSDLYGLDGLFLSVLGECQYENSNSTLFTFNILDISSNFNKSYPEINRIIWNGETFTAKYEYPKRGIVVGDTTFITGNVSGTVSSDGLTIKSLKISENSKHNKSNYSYTFSIDVADFTIKRNTNPTFYTYSGYEKGSSVGSKILSIGYSTTGSTSSDPKVTLKGLKYNSTLAPPELTIMFQ